MITILLYIIKAALCLSAFGILFRVLFKQTTFFKFNRFLLLVGSVVCLLLPLIELDTQPSYLQLPFQFLEQELMKSTPQSDLLESAPELDAGNGDDLFTISSFASGENGFLNKLVISLGGVKSALYLFYLSGLLFNLYLLLHVIVRISLLIRRSKKERSEGFRLAITREDIDPCCCGRTILLSEKEFSSPDSMILMHEKMHLRLGHPFDLFYFNLLTVLFWFTPGVWLLLRDLKAMHEFEVDAAILKNGCDAKRYQLLIVKKTVGARRFSLANGFSHIPLKTRIDMMLKKPTNPWTKLKVFIFAPVALTMSYAFAGTNPLNEAFVNDPMIASVFQSDKKESLDQLTDYFSAEMMKWEAIPGNSSVLHALEKSPTHTLLINSQNAILYDQKKVPDALMNLESILRNSLCVTYAKQVTEEGKATPQFLLVQCDQGSNPEILRNYLALVKKAFMQARSQCKNDGAPLSEKELPVLVRVVTPKASAAAPIDPNKVFSGIEVTYMEGNEKKVLKDFTLKELEDALLNKMGNDPNGDFSIKVKNGTPQEEVLALKDVFRKVQQLKINIKSE
ncbi:MAG: M56 family metallopeptidase [Bacteroidales bacterium]